MKRNGLTEEALAGDIAEHMAECYACSVNECSVPRQIEASFWNEVNHRVDEARDR